MRPAAPVGVRIFSHCSSTNSVSVPANLSEGTMKGLMSTLRAMKGRAFNALVLALLTFCVAVPVNQARAQLAPPGSIICSFSAVPSGYVVTEALVGVSQCTGGTGWKVQPPSDGLLICANSPMPSQHVVTEIVDNTSVCRGVKRWKIYAARTNMSICNATIFPAGFGVTSIGPGSGCAGMYRWTIRSLTDGIKVCVGTPLGRGYAATAYTSSSSCNGAGAYTLRIPTDNQLVCADTLPPEGFVITETVGSVPCNGASAHRIRIPQNNMVICSYSPMPAGWQTLGQAATTRCGTAAYGWRIGPFGAPTASFVYVAVELWVKFQDLSTDSEAIVAWNWTFGDGGTSTAQDPEHTYAKSGSYDVTLRATDSSGHTDQTTRTVVVTSPPPPVDITPVLYLLLN